MRPGSARKPCSPGAGRDAAADPRRSGTNARSRPISLVPSVPRAVSVRALSCPAATLRPQWHLDEISALVTPGLTLYSSSTGPDGTPPAGSRSHPTSTLMFLPPRAPELKSKTYGSSCAITGFPTGYSRPTTISSRCVAKPGTGSSINPGRSCRSDAENGPMGSD